MLRNLPSFRTKHPADRQGGVIAGAIRNYYSMDDKLFQWRCLAIPTNVADNRKAPGLFSSQVK